MVESAVLAGVVPYVPFGVALRFNLCVSLRVTVIVSLCK